jgi:anaerobic magnesium-protoporphyrin IX monomethyl ester cyclase
MKVMLIYPLPHVGQKPGPHWLPLGLSFIAASLIRAGHEVSIFDRFAMAAVHSPEKELINTLMLQVIEAQKPDLIGLNTVSPLIYDTAECAALIRRQYGGLLIAGGHHATALPDLTLRKIPELDGVIQGEGELALTRLAGGENPLAIPGVWWRNEDAVCGSEPEQIADLDSLPLPSLALMNMAFYTQRSKTVIKEQYLRAASLVTSRGCLNKCDFCTENLTYGWGVRLHSSGYVFEWIDKILVDYNNIEALYFHDNDFLVDRERAFLICEGLLKSRLKRKIRFAIQARVNRLDPEILTILKRAGCSLIELGIESASQGQLDAVNKNILADMNTKALQMCRKAGIAAHAYMMIGFPGETVADLENKRRWLEKMGRSFTYSINTLRLHPGTKLYRQRGGRFFEESTWTKKEVTAFYNTDHLSTISSQDILTWMKTFHGPDLRRRRRLAVLRGNRPLTLFKLALARIRHQAEARL